MSRIDALSVLDVVASPQVVLMKRERPPCEGHEWRKGRGE